MDTKLQIDRPELSSFERVWDERWLKFSWQDIPFNKLWVTESQWETFDINHVMEICENFHPAIMRACSVADINGKFYLWEGQHTATAAYIFGLDRIHCGVYRCEDMKFKDIPSIEKFTDSQISSLLEMFMKSTGAKTLEDVKKLIKVPDYDV